MCLAVVGDHVRWVAAGEQAAELGASLVDTAAQWSGWADEMVLGLAERRPEVRPGDDVGVRRGRAREVRGDGRPTRNGRVALAEPWRPWRSVATWYLWRSLEPVPVDY